MAFAPAPSAECGGKGRLLWGAQGMGVFVGDLRGIRFASRLSTEPCVGPIVATTRSHPSEAVRAAAEALRPLETLSLGGAGSKVDAAPPLFPKGRRREWR